ncbi:MAG: heme-copper oxidase subunit III [Deltaproteobacteria bacterium]|nr:heme-copper oxidase subunit III [Deltaproteobacteria bacterium]
MLRAAAATSVTVKVPQGVGGRPSGFGNGHPPSSSQPPVEPPISNARLGMLMFIGAEAMFFAGLIGAFVVFRLGSVVWPPPFQPRLPVAVTGINTGILLLSGYTMSRGLRGIRGGSQQGLAGGLLVTALLGTLFLVVQGYEWLRLVHFGLTQATTYGGTFYTLIGLHGAHVLGALLWLLVVLLGAQRGRLSARGQVSVELCGMYWYFVVGLWPILFTFVYLH